MHFALPDLTSLFPRVRNDHIYKLHLLSLNLPLTAQEFIASSLNLGHAGRASREQLGPGLEFLAFSLAANFAAEGNFPQVFCFKPSSIILCYLQDNTQLSAGSWFELSERFQLSPWVLGSFALELHGN